MDDLEADMDGATPYDSNPRFFDLMTTNTSALEWEHRAQDVGIEGRLTGVVPNGTIMVGGTPSADATNTTLHAFKNGAVGASRAHWLRMVHRGMEYDVTSVWRDTQ